MSLDGKQLFADLKKEMSKLIVGQDTLIERLMIALLAGGHVLLEGVPGLAKTRSLTSLSECLSLTLQRAQFTPDLLPSDLVGTQIYRPNTGEFVLRKGPIFTNILLADEINRAPAKVQSALLQAMQEHKVTIGEETLDLPRPFFVLATQNPIEQEGTYPLPEAQMDRFLMKILVTYPSHQEELGILKMTANEITETQHAQHVLDGSQILALQQQVQNLFVDPKIDNYIVTLVQTSRQPEKIRLQGMLEWGASPRASIALRRSAQAMALLHGRDYVTPDDIKLLAPDVLRHRILPSFEAEARGISCEDIIKTLLENVTIP